MTMVDSVADHSGDEDRDRLHEPAILLLEISSGFQIQYLGHDLLHIKGYEFGIELRRMNIILGDGVADVESEFAGMREVSSLYHFRASERTSVIDCDSEPVHVNLLDLEELGEHLHYIQIENVREEAVVEQTSQSQDEQSRERN